MLTFSLRALRSRNPQTVDRYIMLGNVVYCRSNEDSALIFFRITFKIIGMLVEGWFYFLFDWLPR